MASCRQLPFRDLSDGSLAYISDEIVVEFVPFFLADNKFGETDESRREDSSKLNVKDTSHP